MGTIAEKLSYLDTTREKILTETNRLGVGLTEQDKFRDYAKGLHDGYIDVINNGTDTLYDNMEKVTGEGSNITLTGIEEAPMRSELQGNTTQDSTPTPTNPQAINVVTGLQTITTCGKNLFDKNNANSLDAYINGTTGIITSDSNSKTIYIPCKPNTTYTISKIVSSRFRVSYTNTTPTIGTTTNGIISDYTATNITITTGSNAKYLLAWVYNYDGSITYEDILDSIQIEYGETASQYEAYNGTTYEINLGKNLWHFVASEWYMNANATYNIIDENTLQVISDNATYTNVKFKLNLQNGTYTFSLGNVENTNENMTMKRMSLSYYTNNTRTLLQHIDAGTPQTITITNENDRQYVLEFWGTWNTAMVNTATFSNIQIEKGSQATSYASFKTPIELCKINTYQDRIYKMEHDSKNLFNSEMEIGGIDNTTGENVINTYCIRSIDYIPVEPNTTYTLSNLLNYKCLVHEYAEDKTYIQYDGNYSSPRTFTTTENTYYIRVRSAAGEIQNSLAGKYILNLGSTALPYEPYGVLKGAWLIEKNIRKIKLGDLTWLFNATSTTPTNRTVLRIENNPRIENYLSNIFLSSQQNDTTIPNRFVTNTGSGTLISWYISLADSLTGVSSSDTDNEKLNKVKTYLQNNNIYAILPLETPTYTEITDTELLTKLNNWYNQKSIESQTNISVTSGDLPAILNVKALKKYE